MRQRGEGAEAIAVKPSGLRRIRLPVLPTASIPATRPSSSAVIAFTVGLVCVLLLVRPESLSDQRPMVTGTAAAVLFLTLWMTKAVPDYVSALVFFTALTMAGDLGDATIFAGFMSPAVWLVFGGLIVGMAIQNCGIGKRMAVVLLARMGCSYGMLIAGVVCAATLMSFIVPSAVARMMLLLPLVTAIAERAGFAKSTNGHDGIVCAACIGSMLPGYGVLTGTIPSITMFGSAKSLYGITISYADYALANFPVLAVLVAVVLTAVICLLFPARIRPMPDLERPASWTQDEKTMLAILTSTLIFWFADRIHGISPAWIALAAAVVCLAPRIGPARGTSLSEGVNFGMWFMLAAFISMGAVMKHSGFGDAFGAAVVKALQLRPGNDFWNFVGIVGINHLISLGTTQMSSPAIVAALSQYIAQSIDWPLKAVFLSQATAWAMPLLPYEIPMMALALGMGGVTMRRATKLLLALALVGTVVILPAQFLWLRILGIVP